MEINTQIQNPSKQSSTRAVQKQKGKAPEASSRMNFLFQVSHQILNQRSDSSLAKSCRRILSTHWTHLQLGIGRKAVLRSSVDVKRTICKGCHAALIPGKTSKTGTAKSGKGRGVKKFVTVCLQCGLKKQIPVAQIVKQNC